MKESCCVTSKQNKKRTVKTLQFRVLSKWWSAACKCMKLLSRSSWSLPYLVSLSVSRRAKVHLYPKTLHLWKWCRHLSKVLRKHSRLTKSRNASWLSGNTNATWWCVSAQWLSSLYTLTNSCSSALYSRGRTWYKCLKPKSANWTSSHTMRI